MADDSSVTQADLLAQQAAFFESYFKKGAEFTRELMQETQRLRARLAELEDKLARAQIIDVATLSGETVKFGATVTVLDEDTVDWTNVAGVSWLLNRQDGQLFTAPDSPYGVLPVYFQADDGFPLHQLASKIRIEFVVIIVRTQSRSGAQAW